VRETRTRVKICGITNREDAEAAVAYGADALGFNFVPESPRYVGESPVVAEILRYLPPFVSPVAICIDLKDGLRSGIETIQFYTDDAPESIDLSKRCLQAFRIKDESSLEMIAEALTRRRPQALLLDTWHKDKWGGSGETFSWELAREAKARFGLPIILAGGLTPDNVAEAIRMVRPYAVDVSSGVEATPGRKDHARLKAFIEAVRIADRAQGV